MLGQTVPSTGSSREGPIVHGGQPCTVDIQRQWEGGVQVSALSRPQHQSCNGAYQRGMRVLSHADTGSAVGLSVSAVAWGAEWCQASTKRTWAMWNDLTEIVTDLSCWRRYDKMPANVALQFAIAHLWQDRWWHQWLENRSGWPVDWALKSIQSNRPSWIKPRQHWKFKISIWQHENLSLTVLLVISPYDVSLFHSGCSHVWNFTKCYWISPAGLRNSPILTGLGLAFQ